ncbi:MAG: hypothetical protein HKN07_13370 [Acidimicrobiia bacterium]|nr:hypothetical protein [Acidimicrobiia bacterium]
MTHIRTITKVAIAKWWVVLAVSGVAALVAILALQSVERESPKASVRVGLTSASVWPRYQSDLESFSNIVNRDETRAKVRQAIDEEVLDVETEAVEGLFVVEVVVSAETEETAIAAAQEFATIGISVQAEQADGPRQQELAAIRVELDQLEVVLADLEVIESNARDEAVALAAEVNDGEYSVEREGLYRAADAAASRATADRSAAEQRYRTLNNQLSDIELRAVLPAERLFVVQDAQAQSVPAAFKGPFPVLAAALAAALAAITWLVGRDRLRGPIRSAEHVERVLGLPVVADLVDGIDQFAGKRVEQALVSVGAKGTVEVVVDAESGLRSVDVQERLAGAAGGPADSRPGAGTFVSDPTRKPDAAVLAVETGVTTVVSAQSALRLLEMSQTRLIGVILT